MSKLSDGNCGDTVLTVSPVPATVDSDTDDEQDATSDSNNWTRKYATWWGEREAYPNYGRSSEKYKSIPLDARLRSIPLSLLRDM